MSKASVKAEDIDESKATMRNILDVVDNRIVDLIRIWRRQRQEVDIQMRYYVNGLFQAYYNVRRCQRRTRIVRLASLPHTG